MGDGGEDGQVDLEALQAQIDLSLGALSDLADACIPASLRAPRSAKHTNATAKSSTAGLQTRYPRLGLGAEPPRSAGQAADDLALKRRLLGKRARDEPTESSLSKAVNGRRGGSDDDGEESRFTAIRARAASPLSSPTGSPIASTSKPLFNPPTPVKPPPPPTPPAHKTVQPVSFYATGSDGLSKSQLKKQRRKAKLAQPVRRVPLSASALASLLTRRQAVDTEEHGDSDTPQQSPTPSPKRKRKRKRPTIRPPDAVI